MGKLVILAGDPGQGKSQVAIFASSIVIIGGTWPVSDKTSEKGNAVILNAEDGPEDTIVPRLKAAGADLNRVNIVQAIVISGKNQERFFNFTRDTNHLRDVIEKLGGVLLIVVDPISSYLGGIDSHRNSDVRAALNPIAGLANEVNACLLCVIHLDKFG